MRPTSTALAAGLVLLGSATPGFAETIFITGITSSSPLYEIEVPMVEVTDGNIDEAAVRALFAGDRARAEALGELDAATIRIPWITMRSTMEDGPVTTYRGIEIRNVVDGLAATAAMRTTEVQGAEGVNVTLGSLTVENLDVGALLSFYGMGPDAGGTGPVTIYSNIRFAGGTIDAAEVKCEIGPATIAEFKARPIAGGQASLMNAATQLQKEERELGEPRPETVSAAIAAYIDFLTSFEMSPMEFGGLTCDGISEQGQQLAIAAGKVLVGGWTKAAIPPISLDAFNVDVKGQGYLRFDNATLKQMDFTNTLTALAAAPALDERWIEANWRKIVPAIEGLAINGLELDVPDDDNPGERVKLSLGAFDLTLGGYTDGIPASTSMTVEGLKLAVPDNAEAFTVALREAGVDELNLGFGLKFDWDPATGTATLSNLSVDADQLGSAVISASLANVSADVFSPDTRIQQRAAQRITVTSLSVNLDNAGLLNLLIAQGAQDAGQNEAAFKTGLIGITAGTTMALLGANPQTLNTVSALSDFINGRPGLALTMTSTDPKGIGVADFELMQRDPRLLAGRIQVNATASGDLPAAPAATTTPAPAAPGAGEAGAATAQ